MTVLAVSAVMAVPVVTAIPFKLNPPFSSSRIFNYLGINFPITQDICYTGLSGRNYFV